MLSFTVNPQTIAHLSHRINKATSALLTAPIKGYSGGCPFLRGISTIGNPITCGGSPCDTTTSDDTTTTTATTALETPESSYAKSTFQAESSSSHDQGGPNRSFSSSSGLSNSLHQSLNQSYETKRSEYTVYQQQQQQQPLNTDTNDEQEASISEKKGDKATCSSKTTRAAAAAASYYATNHNNLQIFDYQSRMRKLIEAKKNDESYRVFKRVHRISSSFPHGIEQERPVTIWCSNDYFGMSSHPKVREAIMMALNEFGAGSGGTRNIAGNSPVHEQLEWELADLHNKEASLLFSSCFVANDSTLCTLLKLIPNCEVVSDAGNHASMIQGIRNSGVKKHIFRAFDPVDLEEKLKQIPISTPKIVAFETVHSMTGDVSDVERMCDIAHKYGALTFVDEVHAVGLYGDRGAGIAQRDGCMDKIDIVSGTLGKAYGNCGGYVASSAEIIDVVRSYAAGFIFTTSLPPTVVCGAIESVRILKGDEGKYLRQLQQNNVFHMKRALTAAGLPHYHSKSHIIPIPIGNASKCTQVSNDLMELGHYIQSINYPTVSRGTERLRVSVTPYHSEQMIDSLIEKLVSVWHKNELDFLPPVELASQCRRHQMRQQAETLAGQSPWCDLCHKEMDLCTRSPDNKVMVGQ